MPSSLRKKSFKIKLVVNDSLIWKPKKALQCMYVVHTKSCTKEKACRELLTDTLPVVFIRLFLSCLYSDYFTKSSINLNMHVTLENFGGTFSTFFASCRQNNCLI